MAEQDTAGTERIAEAFASARAQERAALMPYLMGGFPNLETSIEVAQAYAEGGADLVELGVPFSDPLADGPVIHGAATEALARGTTLEDVLAICERIAGALPVLPMVYANMVLARGSEPFAEQLAGAGAAGAIIPDLPLEEDGEIRAALEARALALIPLVAPTTPHERRRRICERAQGFVYVVSDTRVTGERDELPVGLSDLVDSVRAEASVPAAVGFGIGTPEQAGAVGRIADGVIIGSRLVRLVADAGESAAAAGAVREFLAACSEAISGPSRVG
jgi:tryptophan synthase alpha chain